MATGAAIVLVSSELPEILHLSHRLYVMHRSRMVAELTGADINEQAVLSHFFREDVADRFAAATPKGSTMSQALPSAASPSFSQRLLRIYDRVGFLPVVLVALVVVLALVVPRFLSLQNVFNVLRSSSYLVIIAAGQMMVLIVGGFDLSVGAVVALASVVTALAMVWANGVAPGQTAVVVLLGVFGGPCQRIRSRPRQRLERGVPARLALHRHARLDVDRHRGRAAADERHSRLRHAEGLC